MSKNRQTQRLQERLAAKDDVRLILPHLEAIANSLANDNCRRAFWSKLKRTAGRKRAEIDQKKETEPK